MIAIASDHAGLQSKQELISYLEQKGYHCKDYGTYTPDSCDYPDFAYLVGKSVVKGECEKGILICGTGIGMSISANKIDGVRCGLCGDTFSAEMTRRHNNANVLAMGARVTPVEKMIEITEIFLNTPYDGGRHENRLKKIQDIEDKEARLWLKK